MKFMSAPSYAERAVLIHYQTANGKRRASGFLIGGTKILTAAHCIGSDMTVLSLNWDAPMPVTIDVVDPDSGFALLDGPDLGHMSYTPVGILQRRWLGAVPVTAIGFPLWRDLNGEPQSAQITGAIPLGEGRSASPGVRASTSLRVKDGLPSKDPTVRSVWEGLSGSAVITESGVLIGVVRGHSPAHGPSTILVDTFDPLATGAGRDLDVRALGLRDHTDWRRIRPSRTVLSTTMPKTRALLFLGSVLFLAGVFATALSSWSGLWWAPVAPALLLATLLISLPAQHDPISGAGWRFTWGRVAALSMLLVFLMTGTNQSLSTFGATTALSIASLWIAVSVLWWIAWPRELTFATTWLGTSTLLSGIILVASGWQLMQRAQVNDAVAELDYTLRLMTGALGANLLVVGTLMAVGAVLILTPNWMVAAVIVSCALCAVGVVGLAILVAAANSRFQDSSMVTMAVAGSIVLGFSVWLALGAYRLLRSASRVILSRATLILLYVATLLFEADGARIESPVTWLWVSAAVFGICGLLHRWCLQGVAAIIMSVLVAWMVSWGVELSASASASEYLLLPMIGFTTLSIALAAYGLSRLGLLEQAGLIIRRVLYRLDRAGLDDAI